MEISCIGYATSTVAAANGARIVLQEDSEFLDEVVVVGYGTQSRANLTGAVATVDVSNLEARPIPDVGRGLQGTTPGLNITVPIADVGTDPVLRIRGQYSSIEGTSSPLILLDNVEIPSLSLVNPDEIESISVLKDAASASIYGAKAAFGVILITSKKGADSETINVTYQNNFAWQSTSKRMEMGRLDALEYAQAAATAAGSTVRGYIAYMTEEGLERAREWDAQYRNAIGSNDPYTYGRDWYVDANGRAIGLRTFNPYDYLVQDWVPAQSHNLGINGRKGSTSFNVSLGYLDQEGMLKPAKEDNFKRYNASIRLSTDVNKFLSVRAGAMYSKRSKRYAFASLQTTGTATPWLYVYRWASNVPFGFDQFGNRLRSPDNEFAQANVAEQTNNYTSINIGGTVHVLPNWDVNIDYTHSNLEYIHNQPGIRFSADNNWTSAGVWNDDDGNPVYVNSAGAIVPAGTAGAMLGYRFPFMEYTSHGAAMDSYTRTVRNSRRNTLDINTTYDWTIRRDHNLKFLLGMNRVTYDWEENWSNITDLLELSNPQFGLAQGVQTAGGDTNWESQLGFFGRINYNYKERYLLEANLRYDGTSKFPTALRWRWFPSFSAGWRVTEEPWMTWAKPVLTSLKLRSSWGTIGDQTVSNTLYTSTMGMGPESWLIGSSKLIYVGTPSAISPDITWQDITTLDFGVDARFINSDLGVSFDWFQRDTKNMIVPMEGVPATFGTTAPKSNYGSLRTTGWELAIDYNHRFDNGLGINATFTLADARTKITAYGSTNSIDSWYVGKTYGEIWGYQVDRLYQKSDFVYDNAGNLVTTWALNGKEVAAGTAGAKEVNKLSDPNGVYQDFFQAGNFRFGPGDVKYKDVNGDGKITPESRTVDDHGDLSVIGNSTPRFEYGLQLGADWKGFDLSILIQGVGQRKLWGNGSLAIPGFQSGDGAIPEAIASDYWTEDRTDAFYPRPWNMGGGNDAYNFRVNDRYILNMAYLRVKNITVGYSVPSQLIRKIYFKQARVYVSLENFFTFDKLRGLPLDPEVVNGRTTFVESDAWGRTGNSLPSYKSVSLGVQLTF